MKRLVVAILFLTLFVGTALADEVGYIPAVTNQSLIVVSSIRAAKLAIDAGKVNNKDAFRSLQDTKSILIINKGTPVQVATVDGKVWMTGGFCIVTLRDKSMWLCPLEGLHQLTEI